MNQKTLARRSLMNLGGWLGKKCKEERLSYRKAAEKAGLSHATIADIIGGNRPSATTIKKLAGAFCGNGEHQRAALEDFLLSLCGYRSERKEGELSEPLARLMDKLSEFSEAQLELMERFADFVTKIEAKA